MLVKAGDDLDALRTVMHLMEAAPEESRLVAPAVPPVIEERDGQVAGDGAAGNAEGVGGPKAMVLHPAVPFEAGQPDDADLHGVEQGGAEPPAGNLRPTAAGTGQLAEHH